MTIDQTKQAIMKDFRERFNLNYKREIGEDWLGNVEIDELESFLSKSLDRMEEAVRNERLTDKIGINECEICGHSKECFKHY